MRHQYFLASYLGIFFIGVQCLCSGQELFASQDRIYKVPHSPMDMSVKAIKPPPPDHLQITVFEEFPDLCAVSWSRMVFTPVDDQGNQRMDFYEYRVMMPMIFNVEDLHTYGTLENESGTLKIRYTFNNFSLRAYAGYYQFNQTLAVNTLLAQSKENRESEKLPIIHDYFSRWSLFDEPSEEDMDFIRSLGDIIDQQGLYETEIV